MTQLLKESAQRVQQYLADQGSSCEVRELPGSTRTAQEAAQTIGCDVAQIAKSLIFVDKLSKKLVLIVASGVNQVDLKKVNRSQGVRLSKADPKIVKEQTGFAIGGVPPIAHKTRIKTFLDPSLKNYPVIWAAAGTPFSVFSLNSEEIEKLTGGTFIDLKVD